MLRTNILVAMLAGFMMANGYAAQSAEVTDLARHGQEALRQGDSEAAVRDYERLVKLAPRVAGYNLNLGIAYYSSDRPFDAAQSLRQALKLKSDLAEARYYLGASLAESGQCQEALPMLVKAGPHISDQQLKRTIEADGLKCAMAIDRE